MASEWRKLNLAEVYDFSSGLSKPQSAFGSGHPFLSFKDVFYNSAVPKQLTELVQSTEQERARCSVMRGDVFLTRTSETMDELGMSSVALADIPGATFNGFTKRLRPRSEFIVPEFTRYFFRSPVFRAAVNSMSTMSTRASLNNEMLARLTITFPECAEQKAIASILGALDGKIELNRKMNETLEAMARALFKSWFVDFDPVRAKAESRDSGLPAHIADLFPDSFEESQLGPIPRGWEVTTLSELTTVITKGTTPTQESISSATDPGTRVNYIRVNSIDESGIVLAGKVTKIPDFVHTGALKRSIIHANDVLYTIAGTIGRIATAQEWILPANTNQAVAIVRPKSEIPAGFLVLTMRQEVFREQLHANIVHAVQANLSLGMLSKAQCVAPSAAVLAKIFAPIENILAKIDANCTESRTLTALRDALLPKLISGELRVNMGGHSNSYAERLCDA